MANRVPITVHLDSFEGPLDLLLFLIQSHELDISRVSIGKITDQYLSYVRLIQEFNFDAASEFLVMAATLLHWKSRSLLPQDQKPDAQGNGTEDGLLSQEELVRQLLEHQRFLEAGRELSQRPILGEEVFKRAAEKVLIERIWREMSMTDLAMAYQDILIRSRKRTHVLKKETVSISDKITQFSQELPLGKLVELRSLMSPIPSRPEIVVTFLAILELSRLKKMTLHQEGAYTAIYIELIETLKNFDISLASGFDSPAPANPAQIS